ncbi:hypothetical protein Tco_0957937 [Tanacetum coccineum]
MQIHRDRVSRKIWLSAVGSLMFAMICTRPDIAHVVGVVSRYMAKLGREHWEAVKMILRCVKGTSDVALCFGDSDLVVTGYVDSDYVGDLDGSKSTIGYVITLFGGTVSWVSKLQSVVAMSTIEAEYVAAAQASKEAIWLKMLLEEIGYKHEKITLFCDNQSAFPPDADDDGADLEDPNKLFFDDPQPRSPDKPRRTKSQKSNSTTMVGSSSSREAFKKLVQKEMRQDREKNDLIAT